MCHGPQRKLERGAPEKSDGGEGAKQASTRGARRTDDAKGTRERGWTREAGTPVLGGLACDGMCNVPPLCQRWSSVKLISLNWQQMEAIRMSCTAEN